MPKRIAAELARGRGLALRAAATLLAAGALLLGAVELHGLGAAHDAGSALLPTFPDAGHARQTTHLESSRVVLRGPCQACLLHLQTAGVRLLPCARPLPPPRGDLCGRVATAATRPALSTRIQPRAPPA